jgi:hypothetical protein
MVNWALIQSRTLHHDRRPPIAPPELIQRSVFEENKFMHRCRLCILRCKASSRAEPETRFCYLDLLGCSDLNAEIGGSVQYG